MKPLDTIKQRMLRHDQLRQLLGDDKWRAMPIADKLLLLDAKTQQINFDRNLDYFSIREGAIDTADADIFYGAWSEADQAVEAHAQRIREAFDRIDTNVPLEALLEVIEWR